MRLVFSAVEMAGHVAGLQMGLGFASFFDPQHNTSVPVLAQFLSLMTTLLFLAMNGHLIVLRTLIDSFSQMPPTAQPLSARPLMLLVNQGAIIFYRWPAIVDAGGGVFAGDQPGRRRNDPGIAATEYLCHRLSHHVDDRHGFFVFDAARHAAPGAIADRWLHPFRQQLDAGLATRSALALLLTFI